MILLLLAQLELIACHVDFPSAIFSSYCSIEQYESQNMGAVVIFQIRQPGSPTYLPLSGTTVSSWALISVVWSRDGHE